MGIELKKYFESEKEIKVWTTGTGKYAEEYAKNYEKVYNYNFRIIDNIQKDRTFHDLVLALSSHTKINYEVVLCDLKRYLMYYNEYDPTKIKKKNNIIILLVRFILSMSRKLFYGKIEVAVADVLIDSWTPGSLENFYGEEFARKVIENFKCSVVDNICSMKKINNLFQIIECSNYYFRSLVKAWVISQKHKIYLGEYLFRFFSQYLIGNSLKTNSNPKLIISGNDNNFPVIIAKAAGAELMLIQNAKRTIISDSCFRYADYYFELECLPEIDNPVGCIFKNIFYFGSLRLHNQLHKHSSLMSINGYDILFISELQSPYAYSPYFPLEPQYEATKLLNALSETTNLRIAYRCVDEDEMEHLRNKKLISTSITYIPRESDALYSILFKSKMVLSPLSTVCTEAMKLGKKTGFVNLSGNANINYRYKRLGIEYNEKSRLSFEEFIECVGGNNFDTKPYNFQNPQYVDDLVKIIGRVLMQENVH